MIHNNQPQFDLYQVVTNQIIEALEAGTAPWIKPWANAGSHLPLPSNAISGRLYGGINILLLWLAAEEKGYKQSKWLTAKAANEQGARIRRGEKATLIIKYCPIEREKLDETGCVILDAKGEPEMERFAFIKKHYVFNIEQCENLPASFYETTTDIPTTPQYREFAEIRQIIEGMSLTVEIKPSNKAFYRASTDTIVMPQMKQFSSEADYYSVLLHEITHATGHKNRLDREGISSSKSTFGSELYAFEELIAEMGGAFLCAYLGFNTVPQNASYLASWIKVLKSDKKAIFRATGKAREACEYMLDTLQVMQKYEDTLVA